MQPRALFIPHQIMLVLQIAQQFNGEQGMTLSHGKELIFEIVSQARGFRLDQRLKEETVVPGVVLFQIEHDVTEAASQFRDRCL